ncbi:hypothetical protein HC256_006691 [Beauveria bassiana]|nr:hypothetical protein HC256_006691 [Beauveria bassiana]
MKGLQTVTDRVPKNTTDWASNSLGCCCPAAPKRISPSKTHLLASALAWPFYSYNNLACRCAVEAVFRSDKTYHAICTDGGQKVAATETLRLSLNVFIVWRFHSAQNAPL